jgi:5-methylcytosine-specific restriction endonuclease McrA
MVAQTKQCLRCGATFEKPYSESMKSWIERHRFYSVACKYPPRRSKACQECGTDFSVPHHRKDTARFCSHECSARFRDEGKRTAAKKVRQSAAYRTWRDAVFARDGYVCVQCGDRNYEGRGQTVILQADHIKPFALYPGLRLDVNNGRTLCVPCHRATGTFGRQAIYRSPHCVAVA